MFPQIGQLVQKLQIFEQKSAFLTTVHQKHPFIIEGERFENHCNTIDNCVVYNTQNILDVSIEMKI
jgi:hypothetical protein